MDEQKYWILISRYLSNTLTLEETEVLLNWLADDKEREALFHDLGETWNAVRNYPQVFRVDTGEGWKKLKSSLILIEKENEEKAVTYWEKIRRILNNMRAKSHYKKHLEMSLFNNGN